MTRKRVLAIGLACAMASSIALFTGCSNAASADPEATGTQSQTYTHAPLATPAPNAEPTLSANATATVGETSTGMIVTSGSTSGNAGATTARTATTSNAAASGGEQTAGTEEDYDYGTSTPYTMGDRGDYTTVKLGSDNAAVQALQATLTDLGYLNGATGYFGTDTKTALEAFQAANHLTVDGIAGNSTWDVLLSGNAVKA